MAERSEPPKRRLGTLLRLLLDENLSEKLPSHLAPLDVKHMDEMGWCGLKNGALMAEATAHGFTSLITADKNIPHQQNLRGKPIALIVLDIHPNVLEAQTACIPDLMKLLPGVEPGRVYIIEGPHSRRRRG